MENNHIISLLFDKYNTEVFSSTDLLFNYNFDEIKEFIQPFDFEDQLIYLQWVRKEYIQKIKPKKINNDNFIGKIDNEINFLNTSKNNKNVRDYFDIIKLKNYCLKYELSIIELIDSLNIRTNQLNDPEKLLLIKNAIEHFNEANQYIRNMIGKKTKDFQYELNRLQNEEKTIKVKTKDFPKNILKFTNKEYFILLELDQINDKTKILLLLFNQLRNLFKNSESLNSFLNYLNEMHELLHFKFNPMIKNKNIQSKDCHYNKIKFFGEESSLTYIIELMKKENWVTKHNTFSEFNKHFCKPDGSEFNFSQSKNNYENNRSKKFKEKGKPLLSEFLESEIINAKNQNP